MASVTERYLKDGTRVFEIRVSRGRDPVTGKQLTPYSTRYTPPPTWSDKKACKQAQIEAAKFECDCKAGKVKTKAQKQQEIEELRKEEELKKLDDERRPTFKRYVEMLLEEMAVTNAPGTLENYDYVLRRAGPVFNDYKMEDITPAMIKKYIVDFQANGKNYFTGELVGHKTVLKHFIILHRIFASAVENDVLQVSPMQKLKRPKPRKDEIEKEAQVYTEEEAKYIISCLDNESMMWKALVMFMIDSGCRRGEVVGLMWDAVDMTTGEVKIFRNAQYTSGKGTYITTTKNRKNRVLYLNPTVLSVMREWKREQARYLLAQGYPREGYCFTRENGKVLNPQAPTSYLARFGKKYGIQNLHPHALRHTMATISIANGADIVSVSEKLGHSETSVTLDVYSHVNKKAQKRANQILSQALYTPQNESKMQA